MPINPKNKTRLVLSAVFLAGLGYATYATLTPQQHEIPPLGNFTQTHPNYQCNTNQDKTEIVNTDGGVFITQGDPCQSTSTITIEGDVLHYVGGISLDNLAHFNAIVEKLPTPPKTLKINSGGGDIVAGMAMASYIRDNTMDVEVYDMCFSSCANYIFQAGAEKRIHDGTFLGWHGDITSSFKPENAEQEKAEFRADIKSQLPQLSDAELDKMIEVESRKLFVEQPKMERAFYAKYNIDPTANRYGHEHKPSYEEMSSLIGQLYHRYTGWTFSPQVMEQLGIKNINLIDGKWHPNTKDGMKLLYIDTLD